MVTDVRNPNFGILISIGADYLFLVLLVTYFFLRPDVPRHVCDWRLALCDVKNNVM